MTSLSRMVWSGLLLLVVSTPAIASKAVFRHFPIPTPDSGPTAVIATGIGIVFTEFNANKIGFRTLDGRTIEYTIPTPNSGPMDLDLQHRGSGEFVVWFTEFLANKIGRLNIHTGEFREFPIPTLASGPHSIVTTQFPEEVWFTEFYGNKIGRLTAAGEFTEFALPTAGAGPMGITRSYYPDTIWFTEYLVNKLGRMASEGGPIEELTIPTPNSGPTDIQYTGGGRAHFTEFNTGKVGYIDFDRTIGEIVLPTPSSGPYRICRGSLASYDVWFTERLTNRVGVIRYNGAVTEYDLPAGHREPLGCAFGGAETWFAQRTPNALGWVAHDASVVAGAGTFNGWETTISYSNEQLRPTELVASFLRQPITICGVCPWQGYARLPGHGTDSVDVRTGPTLVFSRSYDRGELPTERARVRYAPIPGRATDLPAVRLSTINDRDPQVLVFPGATRSASSRSNLFLSDVWQQGALDVRIDVFSAEGTLLGSEILPPVIGSFVDYLGRLGIHELTNGQIRVTKTGGDALLWGALTTVDGDAIVSDVGRNLSLPDPDVSGGDPLVVIGGVVGTWDTEFDVGNARAEPLSGTMGLQSCPGSTPCPGSLVTFTVPPNGTLTLRASDLSALPAGFALYGIRFGGSGTAPTVRARTVNRARPSQTAVLPALHLSAIRKLDAAALSFPGAAHSAAGARSNLIVAETGLGDASMLVEVFAPSGALLKSIPLSLARGQTAFLADLVRNSGGDVENAHVLVTRAGCQGSLWAILSTFDPNQALSVGWGIAP